jgi:peptidoglycan/LPS O-acetylase OafA/YrhL
MDKRIDGYDFIRSFAILVVFLCHAFKRSTNEVFFIGSHALSPGLTMSLLGFISAALLSTRECDFGAFLIKRFTRIYSSLIFCLIVVLTIHALLGKKVMEMSHAGHVMVQHTLFHFMGMSAVFEMLEVDSEVTIGPGLWFITAIIALYLVFPLLQKVFRHPRGLLHVVLFVALCTMLDFVMYGEQSMWNVVISFAVGVYCSANGYTKRLTETGARLVVPLVGCVGLLTVTVLCTAHVLPNSVRSFLFAFGAGVAKRPEVGVRLAHDLSPQESHAGRTPAEASGAFRGGYDGTGCRAVSWCTSEHREAVLSAVTTAHCQ